MANPFNQFNEGYDQGNQMAQGFARQQAGKALAGGDYAGGANALFKSGQVGGGFAVQDQQRQEQDHPREAAQKLQMLSQIARSLRQIPDDGTQAHRKAALAKFSQTFQAMGLPPQDFEGLDLSDSSLDMFATTTQQHAYQLIQRRDGSTVAVNPMTLEQKPVLAPMQGAAAGGARLPFGWEYDDNGDPVPIDSFVRGKARLAGATRAPRVGRAGSVGHKLPTGFILD